MSAALCLIAWNVAIGRSNCTRTLAYSTASVMRRLARADQLGAQRDRGVVDDAPPDRGVVAVGPDRLGRASSSSVEPRRPCG